MADPAAIERLVKSLHWLGHDTFRLDAGIGSIYFDPYELKSGPIAAIILASHDHFDHCVPANIKKIQRAQTVVVTEAACAAKLTGDVRVLKPGQSLEIKGVRITGVPAYNTDKDFHPQANGWLGFVVVVDGVSIYHAGDTDFIPEMKDLEVDIALLPVSGTYVMTAEQAVEAAKSIKPKLAIPMHYGTIVGDQGMAKKFAAGLTGLVPVKILSKES
jgi:L-ascorbate metabolism protein UlaG (beta-lactamase superfamily)